MTKQEFLDALRRALGDLPPKEIEESVNYYAEMIDDRTEAGMTEQEATADLGDPRTVAHDILFNMPLPKVIKTKCKPKRALRAWEIVLLALGSPIWLPLLIAAFAILLSVYAVLWSLVVSCWAVGAAFGGTSLGCLAVLPGLVMCDLPSSLLYFGIALLAAGLCILLFMGCSKLTALLVRLTVKVTRSMKDLIIGKEKEA